MVGMRETLFIGRFTWPEQCPSPIIKTQYINAAPVSLQHSYFPEGNDFETQSRSIPYNPARVWRLNWRYWRLGFHCLENMIADTLPRTAEIL